jgi:tetratricopeptide (TPR) repeat protein
MILGALRHRIILKRGSDLLRKERWQKAATLLERASSLAPNHWESHNNLAIAFLKLGRWEEAAGMAQRAIRLAPTAADSHDFFGIALLQMERWEEAVVAYQRAITVDPGRYDSYDRSGMALSRLERWEEVVDAYEAALKLDAGRHAAHRRLGVALLRLGRWNDAATAFRRAIDLAEDDPAASTELAGLLSSLASAVGQLEASEEAVSALRRAAAVGSATAARLSLGVELLKLERWNEAVSELAEASVLAPGVGVSHFLQVDPLVRFGRFREALAAHHQAVAVGGEMPGLPGQAAATRFAQRQAAFWTAENLGAEVFAVERWLEQLSVVPAEITPGPRLLFVLDNDFGELATVKYFVLGQELAGRTTLMLPERLYVHNVDALPGRTHRYGSVDDILQMVDREKPDIVFLCSGYLLWEHLAFTAHDLERLLDQLRARGCRVVTADPFLGMLSKQDPRTLLRIDIPTDHPRLTVEQLTEVKRPDEERMWAGYAQAERILRDTYHLYPSYCDVAEDDVAETDARNISFFNDRLVRPTPTTREGTDTPQPHWLFILTGADCGVQMLFEGEIGFADIVASKLVETLAAARHPILIGPSQFVEKLVARMPTAEGIDILSQCPFNQFYSLLLSAEHAFYWNSVSHSLLIRQFNQLPVVLFDRGHLVRNAQGIYDRVVDWYHQGWAPALRDHREPLTLETVEGWVGEYREQAARLVERYRRAPSPKEMIEKLMSRDAILGLRAGVRPMGGEAA